MTNTSTQAVDAYLWAYIDYDEFRVEAGEVQLQPNSTQTVPVTFPAYAPTNGMLQDPGLRFEILPQASSSVYYAQTCTYEAAQNTCQP